MNNYRIDNLQYCNWSKEIFKINNEAKLDAVHVTIAYHEDFKEVKKNVEAWHKYFEDNKDFNEENQMDQSFQLIASCIDKIYSDEEVWATADCTKKEVNEFLESMNSSQFKEIEKFFETMPKLQHTVQVTNPKTKVKSDVVLEGLASFFG